VVRHHTEVPGTSGMTPGEGAHTENSHDSDASDPFSGKLGALGDRIWAVLYSGDMSPDTPAA